MKNRIASILLTILGLVMIPDSVRADNANAAPFKTSSVVVDQELTRAFHSDAEFVGADGACSIPLDEKNTVWLFGDTFVRKSNKSKIDQKSAANQLSFINNSCAVQNLATKKMTFFWHNTAGEPSSLLTPAGRLGLYCWPGDGFVLDEKLFILNKVIAPKKSDTNNPNDINFDWISDELLLVRNAGDQPDRWDTVSSPLKPAVDGLHIGTACFIKSEYVYFYTSIKAEAAGVHPHPTGIARIEAKSLLTDFKSSEITYWDGSTWNRDSTKSKVLFVDGASEMTVTALDGEPYLVATYMPPLSSSILLRFSKNPEGPWSEPIKVYQCPEGQITVLRHACAVYSAKAHPEFAQQKRELVISYCSNPGDLKHYQKRPDLYYPRIIRVRLDRVTP